MKKTILITFSIIILYILGCMIIRRDIVYLADKYRVKNFDLWVTENCNTADNEHLGRYKYNYNKYGYNEISIDQIQDNLAFGIYFINSSFTDVYWMNSNECYMLNSKMVKSIFKSSNCLDYSKKHIDGFLFVVPKWVDILRLKTIFLPFLSQYTIYYWPEENYMYITQIPSEISADENIAGIHIFDVSPSLLHITQTESP